MRLTMTITVEDVADLLRVWAINARMSSRVLAEAVSELLPGEQTISYMAVQRYLAGNWRTGVPDPAVVAAMTKALGHKFSELPPDVRTAIESLRSLVSDEGEGPNPPDIRAVKTSRKVAAPSAGRKPGGIS